MRIAQALLADLIEHALLEAPKECCGMIAAKDGEAVKVFRCTNAADSEYRFEIDGFEQWACLSEIDKDGLELGAIYHSHTSKPAYPSDTDIVCAHWPGVLNLIVGIAWIIDDPPLSGTEPLLSEVRAFLIDQGDVSEIELTVT